MPGTGDTNLFWIANSVFALSAGALLAIFEVRSYKRIVGLPQMDINSWDKILVYWSVWSKSLVLLLFPMVSGLLFILFGFDTVAWWVAAIVSVIICSWITVDVRLQRMTGNHLHFYAVHIFNPDSWEWAGNFSSIHRRLLRYLGQCVALTLILFAACKFGFELLNNLSGWVPGGVAIGVGTLMYLLAIIGIVPARTLVNNSLALERLYNAFPVRLGLFSPNSVPQVTSAAFGVTCDRIFEDVLAPVYQATRQAVALDESNLISRHSLPNVIIIIVESFRADFMQPSYMPRLCEWANKSIQFNRHYAASNSSNLGQFALLYGRSPLVYDVTIEAFPQPQICITLKRAGYLTTHLASSSFKWQKMDLFMQHNGFDRAIIQKEGDWPGRDQRTFNEVRRTIKNSGRTPQLIVVTPISAHYAYNYPPEYAFHETKIVGERGSRRTGLTKHDLQNRYKNCLRFLDDELGQLIDVVGTENNIFIITGDHGESFGEDGGMFHSSLLSDVQTRVPLVIGGSQIQPRSINDSTSHMDILPTLLHAIEGRPVEIKNLHGHDRLVANGVSKQQLLVHQLNDSWDLMLVHPTGRLNINARRDPKVTRVKGFCGPNGRIDPGLSRKPEEVQFWAQALADVVRPITQNT